MESNLNYYAGEQSATFIKDITPPAEWRGCPFAAG
jgi:hypothetical protein